MERVSLLSHRRRVKNLEQWTLYAIMVEGFFLALFPTIAAAAVAFGVITWFLRSRIDSHYKTRSLPLDVPVAIFFLIGAISVLLSSARSPALIYNYCSIAGSFGLTYLIVGQTVQTPAQIKSVAKALAAGAFLVMLWGFFQFVFGVDAADVKWTDPDAFPELRKRIFSTLENPNVLAGYLDVFICLALGLLSTVEHRSQKVVLVSAIILLSACLAMTYSRGAFLAIAIVFLVYGVLKDWRVIILFAAVSILIALNSPTFVDRIFSAFTMGDTSEGVRVGIWVSTVAMISDHPFAGIGWGAYQYIYPQYNYYVADPDIIIYHAHNLYLNCAAEIGIVGALAFCWYFFGTMLMALGAGEIFDGEGSLIERLKKIVKHNFLTRYPAELAATINEVLSDFANAVVNLFSRRTSHKPKKSRANLELVHHDEMKWHRRKVTEENSDDVDDDDKSTADETEFNPTIDLGNVTKIDDRKFLDGLKLGIGLAFLSMALNGFTDNLLFNIPSSMLMWQLGALGAVISSMRN